MSKKETDISQIRKYLNGELDARTMHQLERRAQDDPFLMDALEGYEKTGSDQQVQLNELAGRLKQRISRKERRIIPWRLIGIAASVLIVCSVGVWWLNSNGPNVSKLALAIKPVANKPVAKTTPVPAEKYESNNNTTVTEERKTAKSKPSKKFTATREIAEITVGNPPAEKPVNLNIKDSVAKDTTPLDEAIVMGYTTRKKIDVPGSVNAVSVDTAGKLLQGQVAGVAIKGNNARGDAKEIRIRGIAPGLAENKILSKKIIKGRVIGKDDLLPIAGAIVKVAGTNTGAVTDVNGRFNLPLDSNKTKLIIASIGYQTLQVSTRNQDSLKTIALEPTSSSLNEVVVIGYGSSKNTDEAIIYAHPKTDWSNFKKYLKENAISPDGKTGVVRLSFEVDHNGNINDIIVLKGLSKLTDQKAIDIVNEGPDWVGNSSGQTEKVKLRIKFAK